MLVFHQLRISPKYFQGLVNNGEEWTHEWTDGWADGSRMHTPIFPPLVVEEKVCIICEKIR